MEITPRVPEIFGTLFTKPSKNRNRRHKVAAKLAAVTYDCGTSYSSTVVGSEYNYCNSETTGSGRTDSGATGCGDN